MGRFCELCKPISRQKWEIATFLRHTTLKTDRDAVNSVLEGNKTNSNYFPLMYHDSCATKHFFRDKPKRNYMPGRHVIQTAGKHDQPHIGIGTGDVSNGPLTLTNVIHEQEPRILNCPHEERYKQVI
jgi:hypothetical protein